jgi:SAM-dependent methyltransferase
MPPKCDDRRGPEAGEVQSEQPQQADTFERLSDMLAGFMRTQALCVAAQLGVPDIVSTVPTDIGEIAARVGADESSLYRLLRFLASEGVFAETAPRSFGATPLSDALRSDEHGCARWLAIIRGSEFYRCWAEALEAFRTGEPVFERVYGSAFFKYLTEHPDRGAVFDQAMAEKTRERLAALAGYDWSWVERVADIGGGNGTALATVLRSAPHLQGVLFDLPSVVQPAGSVLEATGVRERCEIVGGDFFNDPLPSADVLILSQILHDWDDERADAILANCRRAVPIGGRLLLVEGVIQDGSEPDFLKLLDLHMLVMLGGKERTESEWRALLTAAGFRLARVMPTGLIEARAA